VEDPVVREQLVWLVERDVTKEHPEAHERECRREAHHDHDNDEQEHGEPEGGGAHVWRAPPIPRWGAVSSISCAPAVHLLRRASSTCSLCASCSSTTSISATSLRRLGHSPALRQTMQRTISAAPCSITNTPATGIIALNW